jgi:hypothetical protein
MVQAAVLGGLFNGILSALPVVSIGNCCCLWILGGGALAAYLEQQNTGRATNAGRGAMAGLLAGVIGAFVWLIVSVLLDPIIGPIQRQALERFLEVAQNVPPEVRDAVESMGREESFMGRVVGFGVQLCLGGVFSSIGGALAGAFLRKDVPPALGGPPPPLP